MRSGPIAHNLCAMSDYHVLDDAELNAVRSDRREFGLAVLEGLSETPKQLPSRYFYDDEGSAIFQEIMGLEEYYLTGCELEILNAQRANILAPLIDRPLNLVDLGSGDGLKTMVLLEHLVEAGADVRYVPIDISEKAMRSVIEAARERMPDLEIVGVVGEYADGMQWLCKEHGDRSNLVLFLGSNIGNFNRLRARTFLRRLWNSLRTDDHVLVGFDLKKDIDVLLAAYDDRLGVTGRFNLNLLERINAELDADFDTSKFRHFATYDVYQGAMTSYLVSLERQTVQIDALEHHIDFEAWEPVHTEYSYKFLESDISALAADTGFAIENQFFDERRYFTDSLWRVQARNTIERRTHR
jgi:dimethylhistidine N-methyltransferase